MLGMVSWANAAEPASAPISLDDLFSDQGARDLAVSPSGRYIAAVVGRADEDVIIVQDIVSDARIRTTRVGHADVGRQYDAHIIGIHWKTEDRLLFRISIAP